MNLQGFYTNKGRSLASKIAGGIAPLTVTRVVAGSGHTADIPSATSLPDIEQTLTVGTAVVEGATATLPVTLAEAQAEGSYSLTELGVYAADPQEGEVLMQVYQLSSAAAITAHGENVLRFYLRQTIGAQGVTVTCSPAGILVDEDLDPLRGSIAKKPDAYLTDTTIYVAKTGSDTTGDGSQEHPFLTIQHAVDSIPKLSLGGVTIQIGAGAYNEDVEILGSLTTKDLCLRADDLGNVSVKTIRAEYCSFLYIENINFTGFDSDGISIYLRRVRFALVRNCSLTNLCTLSTHGAIFAEYGTILMLFATTISNKALALDADASLVFLTLNCSVSGTIALQTGSSAGGIPGAIFKGEATISGTQTKKYGGQIW